VTGWAARGAAFGLGAVAAAGQAPLGFWWLALPALAAIIALVARAPSARAAAGAAWWAGLGHFGLALSWIVEPFLIDIARHGWMAPFALLLMAAGLALFWGVAGALSVLFRRRAMGFAVSLAAMEYARSHVFTGFPWALPGHIWIDTPLAQGAALAGAHGLTLLTLVLAVPPAALGLRGAGVAALAVAAAWWGGAARLAAPVPARADAPLIRLVQPNTSQSDKWDRARARATFEGLLDLTAAPPAVALTVWPETAVPYLLEEGAADIPLAVALAGQGAPVLIGVQRTDGSLRYWNSLAVVAPEGRIAAAYDKHHLVPFGEYLPLGDLLHAWFGLAAFATTEGYGYSAGPGPAVLDLGPLGRAIPLICYEAVFPAIPRHAPGPRADWMVQITNDAWFGTLTGPYQHLALARLRAVETGLPLVRVANTGITAMVDARGQVVASLPLGRRGALDAALPATLPAPPYARWGDLPVLLLLAGLALLARPPRPLDRRPPRA
jgi:apolipoprotein N-acyltransferase